jgi:tetratricopeptide (TPR) repeat protein
VTDRQTSEGKKGWPGYVGVSVGVVLSLLAFWVLHKGQPTGKQLIELELQRRQKLKAEGKWQEPARDELSEPRRLLRDGESARAIEQLDRVIAANPKMAEAYLLRSEAYAKKGDPIRARADYEEAVSLDPKLAARRRP